MMQGDSVTFDKTPKDRQGEYPPGEEALRYYIDFASPTKEVYSWNNEMPNSVEYFSQGNAAYLFGYSYHIPYIKNLAPKLNIGVAKVPQIQGSTQPVNYANYWVYGVSNKTGNVNEAWDFIQSITTKSANAQIYLDKTNKPTALKELIAAQKQDEDLLYFADQLLTSQSWYQGLDSNAAEAIFIEMIDF